MTADTIGARGGALFLGIGAILLLAWLRSDAGMLLANAVEVALALAPV